MERMIVAEKNQAAARYSITGTIGRAGENPSCEALVTDNRAYFDVKLPRSEAQILLVRSIGRCGKVHDGKLVPNEIPQPGKIAHGCARHPVIWEQMDRAAVGALALK